MACATISGRMVQRLREKWSSTNRIIILHPLGPILVNPWNHLPEDYEVTLVTVSGKKVAAECSNALEKMLADCKAAGNRPMICSAYRSGSGQAYNLNRKISQYQAGGLSYETAYAKAMKVVAAPGTSEHQLGLAVDIIDAAYQMMNRRQSETATQQWLMEHCWEYGFICAILMVAQTARASSLNRGTTAM